MTTLTCFKAYDIRGQLGRELNEDIAYRIARAYAEWLKPATVVLGGDIRETSPALKKALSRGLCEAGVNVLDLGMTGTEEVYFATWHLGADGGIEVTASHNPIDYNGFKLVREGSQPISRDTGLEQIRLLAEQAEFAAPAVVPGELRQVDCREAFVEHLLSYIDCSKLKPLKLVVNAGNGAAGPALDAIEAALKTRGVPFEFIKINHQPDGSFPNGIPNPMLEDNRAATREAVLAHGADMGIAWDGDFDRCFLFDEQGNFIEGYYIVGLLAEAFLHKEAGARIIHDPRLTWNTLDIVERNGGEPVQCKAGHAFIKQRMREENAIYGGEMSAHHYFRDFAYCDSGMIPWLLVAELICVRNQSLSALVGERIAAFPSSGEINRKVAAAGEVIQRLESIYVGDALAVDYTDGLSVAFADWRFNLRASNTEPVIRLNVESRGDAALMQAKTAELLAQIGGDPA
ncbi:phosphomannomutase CpsG [Pseudomonas sp. MAP12]|uniref:phosphomannomutase n=1 Tax=Geopseudomonas aromaticivorans TaxID=2849492 RepID=A0ABS6MX61_9GAMM|nr:phosphomannomutase CpsG [Pseudomonas aromaticivorans]MBV2132941.1 phosphomannomutase CpsG [Pseudomonas aromaticivorans]